MSINKRYYESREEWLAIRRELPSFGGSEVGALLGMNPWESPYSLWAKRTGRVPEREDTEAMRQGRDFEDVVAARFAERSGMKVHRVNAIITNDDYPRLHASVDRGIYCEDAGLECKTTNAWNLKHYANGEFPDSYYAQCLTYMAVTGKPTWFLAVMVLGVAFYVYRITTRTDEPLPEWCDGGVTVDEAELAKIDEATRAFWTDHIEADVPPPVDGTEATGEALREAYPVAYGGKVELGRDCVDLLESYQELSDVINEIKDRQNGVKNAIIERMGDHAEATIQDFPGWKITYKNQKSRRLNQTAAKEYLATLGDRAAEFFTETDSRVLRITAPRKTA